jgi:hypothetical protein
MNKSDKSVIISEEAHQGLTLIRFITKETYRAIVDRLVIAELERINAARTAVIASDGADSVPIFTLYFERQQKGV